MTIVGMLGLMFWLNMEFTLLVVAITPFLLLFVARFKKAVKKATREVRRRQGDVLAVLQAGLESVRTVQAFGAQDVEAARLGEASRATVRAALGARRVKSLLSPVVAVVVAVCTALVIWRGAELVIAGAMTVGSLTVFLAYLARFFKPVQDLAKMTTAVAQTNVALERIQAILDIDMSIHDRPDAREPDALHGVGRLRARGLRLQRRGPGAHRRQFFDRSPASSSASSGRRERQVDDRQPDSALLRSRGRADPD